jgi:ubiquinone/menaquinone biosynthesis C-methylase UbiE
MSTQSQWNSAASLYDQNMGEAGDTLNKELIRPAILKLLGNLKDKVVLDSGCGSGYFTFELAQTAQKVIGTDYADQFVEISRKKYAQVSNLSFQTHDVTQPLVFENETFDLVISKMVLQYVPEIKTFAQESFRVLKTTGELIVAIDHPFHTQFYYAQALAGKIHKKYPHLENYFSDTPQTKRSLWDQVELTWYPRTVSTYVESFLKVGFELKAMEELAEEKDDVVLPRILVLKFQK